MGHGIMGKDIAPFASRHPIFEGGHPGDSELGKLIDPVCWAESYSDENLPDFMDSIRDLEINGWKWMDDSDCGRKRIIHAHEWKKDNLRIWLVNESQYNNVGEYEITVVADDDASIQEFLKDFASMFRVSARVDQDKIILQWG